jgi:hypothetical protein
MPVEKKEDNGTRLGPSGTKTKPGEKGEVKSGGWIESEC